MHDLAGSRMLQRPLTCARATRTAATLGLALVLIAGSAAPAPAVQQDEYTMLVGMVEASWRWEPSSPTPPQASTAS